MSDGKRYSVDIPGKFNPGTKSWKTRSLKALEEIWRMINPDKFVIILEQWDDRQQFQAHEAPPEIVKEHGQWNEVAKKLFGKKQ